MIRTQALMPEKTIEADDPYNQLKDMPKYRPKYMPVDSRKTAGRQAGRQSADKPEDGLKTRRKTDGK